nr:unnamed protein product [Callosobruchus chinensis]
MKVRPRIEVYPKKIKA